MTLPKPSELSGHLIGSPLEKSELETVAKNLRVIAKQRGDKWACFTWEEYCEACTHDVTDSEKAALEILNIRGYLSYHDDAYWFTTRIIGMYMMMTPSNTIGEVA